MRKLKLLILIISLYNACSNEQHETSIKKTTKIVPEAQLKIIKDRISFGEINRGDTAEVQFILSNISSHALFIKEAVVDCSCMHPEYQKVIKAHKSDTFKVKFVSKNYSGKIKKHVVLKTNTKEVYQKLTFEGIVTDQNI